MEHLLFSSRPFVKKGACFKVCNGLTINPWKDFWINCLPDQTPLLKDGMDARQWGKIIDLRFKDDTGWNEPVLRHLCNDEFVEAILKIPWLSGQEEDRLFWRGNNLGTFSMGNCYEINGNGGIANSTIWEKLWKAKLHERLKIFIWRILADVIPTWERLNRHFNVGDTSCGLCGAEVENIMHLFKEYLCFLALAFASNWEGKVDSWPYSSLHELEDLCMKTPVTAGFRVWENDSILVLVACLLFCFWNLRNESCFRCKVSVLEAACLLNLTIDEFTEGLVLNWTSPKIWWKNGYLQPLDRGKSIVTLLLLAEELP